MKNAKVTTFIPRMRWKPKSLAAKLVDMGLKFSEGSADEEDPEEDVSLAEDAIDDGNN